MADHLGPTFQALGCEHVGRAGRDVAKHREDFDQVRT